MPAPDRSLPVDGDDDRSPPALEAEDVHKRYPGAVALDGATLRVEPAECVALVGESGSGKTTLLRTFNRMVDPDAGIVRVGGRDVRAWDPVTLRRRTGYVQQEGGLLPHWTILRNAALVPRLRGMDRPEERARRALERVGLPAGTFGHRWPSDLSGGQRQRVAIARALAADPGVILLDEPFGALDAITRSELQEGFAELRRDLHATTLLVTHDLREAIALGDRIAVLLRGRVEQVAPPERLRADPATAYVRSLLERAGVRVP